MRVVQVLCEVSIKVLADDTLVRDDDKQMRFFQIKVISGNLTRLVKSKKFIDAVQAR